MKRLIITGVCIAVVHFLLVVSTTSYVVNTLDERVYSPQEPLATRLAYLTGTILAQPSGVLGLDRFPAAIPVIADSVIWALLIVAILGGCGRTKKERSDNQQLHGTAYRRP